MFPKCIDIYVIYKLRNFVLYILVIDLNIWYRHTGQPGVDHYDWYNSNRRSTNVRKVIADVGDHQITHVVTSAEHVQSLSIIATNLTHLRVKPIRDSKDIQRYLCLCRYVHVLSVLTCIILYIAPHTTYSQFYNKFLITF